ncbi:hypothetical protein FQZ97_1152150 [compost metagenome]
MTAQEFAGRFEAADARHLDVHQDHVGFQFAGFLQRLLTGLGLPYDLQAIDIGQHARDACSNQIVVIDHQHPNQADSSLRIKQRS